MAPWRIAKSLSAAHGGHDVPLHVASARSPRYSPPCNLVGAPAILAHARVLTPPEAVGVGAGGDVGLCTARAATRAASTSTAALHSSQSAPPALPTAQASLSGPVAGPVGCHHGPICNLGQSQNMRQA